MTWWTITAPHFVAGLAVDKGRVVTAAPILGWAVGRSWTVVKQYCRRKGWHGDTISGA